MFEENNNCCRTGLSDISFFTFDVFITNVRNDNQTADYIKMKFKIKNYLFVQHTGPHVSTGVAWLQCFYQYNLFTALANVCCLQFVKMQLLAQHMFLVLLSKGVAHCTVQLDVCGCSLDGFFQYVFMYVWARAAGVVGLAIQGTTLLDIF